MKTRGSKEVEKIYDQANSSLEALLQTLRRGGPETRDAIVALARIAAKATWLFGEAAITPGLDKIVQDVARQRDFIATLRADGSLFQSIRKTLDELQLFAPLVGRPRDKGVGAIERELTGLLRTELQTFRRAILAPSTFQPAIEPSVRRKLLARSNDCALWCNEFLVWLEPKRFLLQDVRFVSLVEQKTKEIKRPDPVEWWYKKKIRELLKPVLKATDWTNIECR